MNTEHNARKQRGFTLIELLVVIAIIGVLAGILMPSLARAKQAARITQAKTEMQGIKAAIQQYYNTYNRYPTPKWVRTQGVDANFNPDYTFGTFGVSGPGNPGFVAKDGTVTLVTSNPANFPQTNNAAMMYILMNIDPVTGRNGHEENRQNIIFLNAKGGAATNAPGLGVDYVYRDPWGSPYIISVDLNYDGSTRDSFHRSDRVARNASGNMLVGLINNGKDSAEVRDPIAVWSLGPDRQANGNLRANQGVNEDNILTWQ